MRVILVYKNFAANKNISHIGLGVAGLNNVKCLTAAGIEAEVWPIVSSADLAARLTSEAAQPHLTPVTHVVVSAPWIPTNDLQVLVNKYPRIKFAVNSHSNVGFLQADSNGVRLIRESMGLESAAPNFFTAGNSLKYCKWINSAFGVPCTYLPNMYYINASSNVNRPLWRGGTLRIGAFGATRPLKNFMSAAGAALTISRTLKADVELWVSSGRAEGGGEVVLRSVNAMLDGLPNIKLVYSGWQSWPMFRQVVGNMHLCLQPSYTESFNMVTADGIVGGVPSVVSEAIDWAPEHWKAKVDDVIDIARVGATLLSDAGASFEGLAALTKHNVESLTAWKSWLN